MRSLSLLYRQSAAGFRMLLLSTVLLGIAYPFVVWSVAHLPGLSGRAEGSVISVDGKPVGSSLIGVDPVPANPASDGPPGGPSIGTDRYFHTRPSATAKDALGPGDPSTSAASNKGGSDTDLVAVISRRRDAIAAREAVAPNQVPADAVTASASGVDPQISPAYAALQVARVARVTGLAPPEVSRLVAASTDGRFLGFLGEPGVNVTELNIAVAAARG